MLCIDGVTGVGKTTQIGMYRNLLRSQNKDHKLFMFEEVDETSETNTQLIEITEYLRENPESIALCDGSMATDIADDMANNMLQDDIWDKHQSNLQRYAAMSSEFNIVNILLTPTDFDMCQKRLDKRCNVFGGEEVNIENVEHLKRTSAILKRFDDSILTTNISFHNIEVSPDDSMLDVHAKIKEIVKKA